MTINRAERWLLSSQLSMPITQNRAVKGVGLSLFRTNQTSALHINTPLPRAIHPFTQFTTHAEGHQPFNQWHRRFTDTAPQEPKAF